MNEINNSTELEKISLLKLLRKIWSSRKKIIFFTLFCSFLGIVVAINSPNIYTSSTIFIPKIKSDASLKSGSLSGIASLAGINLNDMGGSNSEIKPSLYPLLVRSNPFIDTLLKVTVPFNDREITLREYLSQKKTVSILSYFKKYTIGLPSLIRSNLSINKDIPVISSNIRQFSLDEESLFEETKDLINLSVDKKDGFVRMAVEEANPVIAALIVTNARKILQQKVIEFKIKNAQELLSFTENLYFQKKTEFEALQDKLALFTDQNQNISSKLFQNKLIRLETEFDIAKVVNEELAKQVEQARIQITKDTPIFTIIEPAIIPGRRSSPNRAEIVIGFSFFGAFLFLGYLIIERPIKKFKSEILS